MQMRALAGARESIMKTELAYRGYVVSRFGGEYRAVPTDPDEVSVAIHARTFPKMCGFIDQLWDSLDRPLAEMPEWVQLWLRIGQRKVSPDAGDAFNSLLSTFDLITDDSPGDIPTYTVDALGYIDYFNEAAAELWGRRPEIGVEKFTGAIRLLEQDGMTEIPPHRTPVAMALAEGRPIRGAVLVMERADGSLVHYKPNPTPLRDDDGSITGVINYMVVIDKKALCRSS
jgi:PAS domain-containing protein